MVNEPRGLEEQIDSLLAGMSSGHPEPSSSHDRTPVHNGMKSWEVDVQRVGNGNLYQGASDLDHDAQSVSNITFSTPYSSAPMPKAAEISGDRPSQREQSYESQPQTNTTQRTPPSLKTVQHDVERFVGRHGFAAALGGLALLATLGVGGYMMFGGKKAAHSEAAKTVEVSPLVNKVSGKQVLYDGKLEGYNVRYEETFDASKPVESRQLNRMIVRDGRFTYTFTDSFNATPLDWQVDGESYSLRDGLEKVVISSPYTETEMVSIDANKDAFAKAEKAYRDTRLALLHQLRTRYENNMESISKGMQSIDEKK